MQTIVESMEKKYGSLNRVWVMDRGMVSEENLKFLRERGGQYIVGTPKAMLRQFEQHLTEQDWTAAQAGRRSEARARRPTATETFVLARSADRREKEQAMHEKFTARLEAGLQKMQAAAEAGRLKEEAAAGERLGRLKQQNWRASQAFDVTIKKLAAAARQAAAGDHLAAQGEVRRLGATGRRLLPAAQQPHGRRRGDAVETLHPTDRGRMGLSHHQGRTGDSPDLAPERRPREGPHPGLLPGLCAVEDAGRLDANCRPGRCPADAARRIGEDQKRRRGAPRPLAARRPRTTDHLRCVTEPDAAQAVLLHRLGLTLPRRLRRLDDLIQM